MGVVNAFIDPIRNSDDPNRADFSGINGLLQGKTEKAGNDFGRVIVNFWGVFWMVDIASDIGIPKGSEDFGQTFGYWGIPQGPYLFVPLWGPTTVRDGTGTLIRVWYGPVGYIPYVPFRNSLYGLGAVDLRANALGTTSLIEASLDQYTFIRRACLQRQYDAYDGTPPPKRTNNAQFPTFRNTCAALILPGQAVPALAQEIRCVVKASRARCRRSCAPIPRCRPATSSGAR
jgi:ABC-type transporter lipoprotein component MlaA